MTERKLRKELGLFSVTAITAGIIIGAGLFVVTGIAAKYAGSLVWLAYVLGAIPVFLVGLTSANLSTLYPVEGGSYVYPSRILHPVVGFLTGWAMWLGIIGPVAITAKAFIQYVNALPGAGLAIPVVTGAIVLSLAVFVLNYMGIKAVSWVQNILFVLLVAGIAIFTLWGIPYIDGSLLSAGSPLGFGGVMKATSLLIFSYAGLTIATDLGEETKDPHKTLPLGIGLGILIPALLYSLSSLICVGVMPWDAFSASDAPYAAAASSFMGPAGVTFVCLVAFAAIISSHNGEQAVAARIGFSLSRDKIITGKLAKINDYGVPHYALIASVAIAIFLIVSGTIELVATIVVACFLFEWITFHISAIVAPKKYPDMYEKAGFKLNGWKVIFPVAGLIISIYLFVLQGATALLYFAVWMAVGLVVYFIGVSANREEIMKLVKEWPRDRYLDEADHKESGASL